MTSRPLAEAVEKVGRAAAFRRLGAEHLALKGISVLTNRRSLAGGTDEFLVHALIGRQQAQLTGRTDLRDAAERQLGTVGKHQVDVTVGTGVSR